MPISAPVALAIAAGVSAAAGAAGVGVSIAAARQQAKAQEKALEFNAEVAENNAIAAGQQAEYESRQVRRRNLQLLGKQRAAAAKSGVLISGSVADVIQDSAVQGELDRLAALYTGAVASGREQSTSKLHRMGASNVRSQAGLATAGTLIGGLGTTASGAANLANQPVFQSNSSSSTRIQ